MSDLSEEFPTVYHARIEIERLRREIERVHRHLDKAKIPRQIKPIGELDVGHRCAYAASVIVDQRKNLERLNERLKGKLLV